MYPNETSYRSHSNAFLSLVFLTAVTACEPSTSSSTHWLTCEAVSDCPTAAAVDCSDGYCVDKNGDKINSSASNSRGAGGSSGASFTASSAASTTGTRGGNGTGTSSGAVSQAGAIATGSTTNNGGSSSHSTSAGSGGITASSEGGVAQLGGAGNGSGGATTVSAGSNARGGAAGNGGTTAHAGGVTNNGGATSVAGGTSLGGTSGAAGASSSSAAGVCSVTAEFLEPLKACNLDTDCEKLRYQVNCCGTSAWVSVRRDNLVDLQACLATRPAFPMCGCASTADTTEDGRYASSNGSDVAARCVANRCQTRATTRSCGPTAPINCTESQLCVSYETTIGPTSSVEYACVTNPCSDKLSCTCAQSVCSLRTDTTRTCNQPIGVGITVFTDIMCQDNRQ